MRIRVAIMLAGVGLAAPAYGSIVNGDFQSGVLAPSYSSFSQQSTNGSADLPIDSVNDEGTFAIVSYDTIHESWVDFADHTTGDENGRYMIVNGADDGSGPAWGQSGIAVEPNTDYIVSGWFASLYATAIAELEWRIFGGGNDVNSFASGVSISDAFSAPNELATWEERSFQFNSGPHSWLAIEIWDTNGQAQGNDYGVDDISIREVPTPGTLAVLGLGGVVGVIRRRK